MSFSKCVFLVLFLDSQPFYLLYSLSLRLCLLFKIYAFEIHFMLPVLSDVIGNTDYRLQVFLYYYLVDTRDHN